MTDNRSHILEYIRTRDYSPTVREIAKSLGLGASTVQYHLERLERDGLISRNGRRIVVKEAS
jgi:predicted transcriptional regulator